jgi:cytoskeletal protein CcmA (bactofilin family)
MAAIPVIAAMLAWTLFILTPASVFSAELRHGDAIVVPAGERIEDDLYAFGQTVTIYGTVNGDVIAAGQSVNITGTVTGDVLAAGITVVVAGPVNGSARLAGQTVEISAPIGDDLLAGAATLNVGPRAPIGRDVLVGGSAVTIIGPVARSIRAAAERLTIGGPVGGDLMAQVGTLRLARGADLQGSLSYASGSEAIVEPGATVRGTTTRLEAEAAPTAPSPAAQLGQRTLDWLRTLIGLSVLGLLLVLMFPGFMQRSMEAIVQAPWACLGLGVALLIGGPVTAVLLFGAGLLAGGWWLGLLAFALYLGMLPVGSAIVGLFVGRLVMQRAGRPGVASGWSLLVGLALLGVVSLVPFAGGIAILAVLLFGLGAGLLALKAAYDQPATGAGAPPPPEIPIERYGEPIPAR